MSNIDILRTQALELKQKGLSQREIADELHLSSTAVEWLLGPKKSSQGAPPDVRIGWRSLGVYPRRTRYLAQALADIAREELHGKQVDCVIGVAINGISLATYVAEEMGLELSVYRALDEEKKKGTFGANFASIKGKNCILVDDVLGTGATLAGAIDMLKKEGGKAVLALVVVNKRSEDFVGDDKVRGLIRTLAVHC